MCGRKSRRKGSAGELELEKLYEDHGLRAKRSGWMQMELEGVPDVTLLDFPEVHTECKRVEKAAFKQWYRQAEEAAPDKLKVVFNRCNHGDWMVYLKAEDFLPMLKLFLENKPE